jgi:uncharacterized membrane protein
MGTTNARLLDVLVATYNNIDDAAADLENLRKLYRGLGTSPNFDAAIISKNKFGHVKINETYEAGTRIEALKGVGFGLAAGLIAAIFPAIGIGAALAAGGAGGAAIGALVGYAQHAVPREDLKAIGDLLYPSEAALVAVYETNLADQVAQNIRAVKQTVKRMEDIEAAELADEIKKAAA